MFKENFCNALQRRRSMSEEGFSIIEVVVTTSIILIITAVGMVPLTSIVEDSRKDAETTAVQQTEQIVLKYMFDGDESTDPLRAAAIYNQGNDRDNEHYGVKVTVEDDGTSYVITGVHTDRDDDADGQQVMVSH